MVRGFLNLLFLIWFVSCSSLPDASSNLIESHIETKIIEILESQMDLRLLVLSPRAFSVSSCPMSEEKIESALRQSTVEIESALLHHFENYPNFTLIEDTNLADVLAGIELKNSGITSKQIASIGMATGANYLILNSFSFSCSIEKQEFAQEGVTKLIRVGSKKTDAIDVTKFVFGYTNQELEYPAKRGFLNGNKVIYDQSNGRFFKAKR